MTAKQPIYNLPVIPLQKKLRQKNFNPWPSVCLLKISIRLKNQSNFEHKNLFPLLSFVSFLFTYLIPLLYPIIKYVPFPIFKSKLNTWNNFVLISNLGAFVDLACKLLYTVLYAMADQKSYFFNVRNWQKIYSDINESL